VWAATFFDLDDLNCVCATGVVETMTSRYGVKSAVRPRSSVGRSMLPSGNGEKASTELGFLVVLVEGKVSGYRPNIRVLLTTRPTIPIPLVARCENAMPLSSAETKAV